MVQHFVTIVRQQQQQQQQQIAFADRLFRLRFHRPASSVHPTAIGCACPAGGQHSPTGDGQQQQQQQQQQQEEEEEEETQEAQEATCAGQGRRRKRRRRAGRRRGRQKPATTGRRWQKGGTTSAVHRHPHRFEQFASTEATHSAGLWTDDVSLLQAEILRQFQGTRMGRLDHCTQRILRQLLPRRLRQWGSRKSARIVPQLPFTRS